jgi:hypothetical protein
VRRLVTVLLVTAVAAIAVAASLDVFRSSSPVETGERASGPSAATTSVGETTAPPPPFWGDPTTGGYHRWIIRLGRSAGAAWEKTMMLDPGTYELTFRISLPRTADVEVSFQSTRAATVTFGLFGPRVPRDCTRKNGRDVCSGALEIEQHHSEEWTLTVRKLSARRAVVHLLIAVFRVPPTEN